MRPDCNMNRNGPGIGVFIVMKDFILPRGTVRSITRCFCKKAPGFAPSCQVRDIFTAGNAMGKMHPLLTGTGTLSRFGKSQSNARTKPEKHRLFSSVFEFEVSAKITFMIFFGASLNPKRGYIRFRFIVGSNGRHKPNLPLSARSLS